MKAATLIAAALTLVACHHHAPPARPTLHVVTVRRGCLDTPPPVPQPITIGRPKQVCAQILARCQGAWCAGAMAACTDWAAFLRLRDALRLEMQLDALTSYARDAWITCGPEPAPDAGQPPADAGTRSKP